MTPSRRIEQVMPGIPPAPGFAEIFPDIDPLMGSDPEWIVGMDVPGEAIYRTFFLGLKSTEHAVPDDEHTGVVLVQVLQIGCMMHTVMGGSIENKLNGAGQFADSLRMDPELVNKADGLHGHHHRRMEAKEGHPDPEKEGAGEVDRDRLLEGRQIMRDQLAGIALLRDDAGRA